MQSRKLAAVAIIGLGSALSTPAQEVVRPALSQEGANLPIQKIGKEDLLAVQVYDSPELTRTVRVSADGSIRLPMLKAPITVEGLLPNDVEVLIADALKRAQLLVDPFVTVNVAEYHSRPISITGAVRSPTIFQAIGSVSLLDAIARAGGLDPTAGGEIIVTRPNGDAGQSVQRVPVKLLLEGGDPTLNLRLTGGEQIRVPVVGTIVVTGNVRESGIFPVQDNGTSTVMTAIAQAKGLGQYRPKVIYIYRMDDQGVRHEIPVDMKQLSARKIPDVVLQAKDVVYVPENDRARITASALDRIAGFGSTAASGALIYRR